MRFKALVVALLLAACNKAPPEIRYQQVYCLTPDQYTRLVTAMPPKIGDKLTNDAQKDFKLSAEQNVLVRAYANGLLQVLGGCVGPAS